MRREQWRRKQGITMAGEWAMNGLVNGPVNGLVNGLVLGLALGLRLAWRSVGAKGLKLALLVSEAGGIMLRDRSNRSSGLFATVCSPWSVRHGLFAMVCP